jgi:hypothetical protein
MAYLLYLKNLPAGEAGWLSEASRQRILRKKGSIGLVVDA